MRGALRGLPLVLLLSLSPLPAAAGSFALSLPAGRAVTVDSPSRLVFRVTNSDSSEGLSRIALLFPSGYRVIGGSPPAGWTIGQGSGGPAGDGGEVSFRTSDEAKCTGAIAKGSSLVFGVELIAPASRSITPDSLVSARGEQSCRGVAFDPPATLPSWDRVGIEAALSAGPAILGLGGAVAVTLTVSNLSTVELTEISALLRQTGTGSVSRMEGPTTPTLALAPGASGSLTWTARAASPGVIAFSGQAIAKSVTSPSVRSDLLFVGDLDVSLSVTPEQVPSGQDVQIQMTVMNRGPIRVANVTPSLLGFDGSASASAPAGPTPPSQSLLEPGESTAFAWAVTVTGKPGETYAFSGWAMAEGETIVSANATSNRGAVGQQELASEPQPTEGGATLGGGGAEGGAGADSVASSGASAAPPAASATLQFVAVNHNGSQTGGTQFSGSLVRDLRIIVGWQNLSGSHTQRLDLFSPDGSLYQRLSTQFSVASAVEARLPVGGTWITQYALFGAWRADVFLDGQGSPISSGLFVLTP